MFFVAEDEVGVGLAALQRDADGHLADRAAGERVGAGEGLRAEHHVDAECAALPDEAVEQQRGVLGELVVVDEEFLEFVDDQQSRGIGLSGRARGSRRGLARRACGTVRRGGGARRRAVRARSRRIRVRFRWRSRGRAASGPLA